MIDYRLPLDALPDPLAIETPADRFDVEIAPPGSKSVTNRAYVLAALAEGESRIDRPLRADDTDRLLTALETLGAAVRWDGDDVVIGGVGGRFPKGGRVDLGDGGTPARFMIAAACLAAEPVVVDGSPRMRERPVAEGVALMREVGATIEYLEADGRLPVRAGGGSPPVGGTLRIPPLASSQFASALMLVASFLRDGVTLILEGPVTSVTYLDVTSAYLRQYPLRCEGTQRVAAGGAVELERTIPRQHVAGRAIEIEPDASSAVYWLAAAAIGPDGARARIPGLDPGSVQPDAGFGRVLAEMGASWTPAPDARIERGERLLEGIERDMAGMPDAAVCLGAIAAIAGGPSRLTGLQTLRVKETDRIGALATELRRLGCTVETTDDAIAIDPASRHDDPITIETYNDHRMAMAFAVLGLTRPGISIRDPVCVAKSYPGFWRDFGRLIAAARTPPPPPR